MKRGFLLRVYGKRSMRVSATEGGKEGVVRSDETPAVQDVCARMFL